MRKKKKKDEKSVANNAIHSFLIHSSNTGASPPSASDLAPSEDLLLCSDSWRCLRRLKMDAPSTPSRQMPCVQTEQIRNKKEREETEAFRNMTKQKSNQPKKEKKKKKEGNNNKRTNKQTKINK